MKKQFFAGLAAASLACGISLAGCKYTSSYSASSMAQTSNSHSVTVTFGEFSGTKSYTLKTKNGSKKLSYSGRIESGGAEVYYDLDGTKKELFSLGAGESVEASLDVPENTTVYVIIETSEKCTNGAFGFSTE